MFSLTNAEIQDVSNIHLGIESLPLLKSDISCQSAKYQAVTDILFPQTVEKGRSHQEISLHQKRYHSHFTAVILTGPFAVYEIWRGWRFVRVTTGFDGKKEDGAYKNLRLVQTFMDWQNMAGLFCDILITSGTGFEVYNPSYSGMIIKRCRRPMVTSWNSRKHMAAW